MSVRPATSTLEGLLADPGHSLGLEEAVVCVLFGGRSSEREVSVASGQMMIQALSTATGPEDRRGPARVRGVEILPDGRWQIGRQALSPGVALDALTDVDVFFSALHGGEGENGAIQGLLQCCGRAFTGSGVAASAVGMDKVHTRDLMAARGVRVARGIVVSRARWRTRSKEVQSELAEWNAAGFVVKPREGGSSVGCVIVRELAELGDALEEAHTWEADALVEEHIAGVEATAGVLHLPGEGPRALPAVEIRPHAGHFFDYHEKYSEGGAVEICPPESLPDVVCERLGAIALLAHETLRCEGYSRSDFICPTSGSARESEPVFLELNTLPGMTPRSLLPCEAEAAGIDYRTLCLLIAAEARDRPREAGP